MTVGSLAQAIVRWWYVLLAGVLSTGAVGGLVMRHEGVYWSQADVVFLAPQSARYPNNLTTSTSDLVSIAGIVERIINGSSEAARTASAATTLFGQGIYDGSSIRLPDSGGQWAHNFERQVLDVQVTGPSEHEVRARQQEIIVHIENTLDELQDDAGVDSGSRVTVEVASTPPNVYYLAGDPKRALAMTAVLGAGTTLFLVAQLDLRRERRRKAEPAQPLGDALDAATRG